MPKLGGDGPNLHLVTPFRPRSRAAAPPHLACWPASKLRARKPRTLVRETSGTGRRGQGIAALLGVVVMVVASCAPPAPPAKPKPPATTTTSVAPKPTATPPVASSCKASASAATASAPDAPTPAAVTPSAEPPTAPSGTTGVHTLDTTAEITAAAREAATTAERSGADEVTVVAVDATGRPSLVTTSPSDAVATALATSQTHDVVGVEVPTEVHALVDPAASSADPLVSKQWALKSFHFGALWPCGRGAGVTVAVVDSGVQGNHPDLKGRVLGGVAFLNGDPAQLGGGSSDVNGHGTHVAGIIAAGDNGVGVVGVAPEATILPVRVLDATGSGFTTDVARGITWAVDHQAKVVNLSLGSDVNSASVDTALAYANSHGVVVVAAAGNQGVGGPVEYPAAVPTVIAVAGLDENGGIGVYSTRGSYVDVAAPGTLIWSTFPPSTWATLTGTSMASPHVAGLVALILDGRGAITPAAMLARLTSTATDAGASGVDPAYGWGRVNPVAAFNAP